MARRVTLARCMNVAHLSRAEAGHLPPALRNWWEAAELVRLRDQALRRVNMLEGMLDRLEWRRGGFDRILRWVRRMARQHPARRPLEFARLPMQQKLDVAAAWAGIGPDFRNTADVYGDHRRRVVYSSARRGYVPQFRDVRRTGAGERGE